MSELLRTLGNSGGSAYEEISIIKRLENRKTFHLKQVEDIDKILDITKENPKVIELLIESLSKIII